MLAFNPITAVPYGLLLAATGVDPFTGYRLSGAERFLAVLPALGKAYGALARAGDGLADAGRLGRPGRLDDLVAGRPPAETTISSGLRGQPAAIVRGYGELSTRQGAVLADLPKFGSKVVVARTAVRPKDIAALTAATGDEFALFTRGSFRMVVRGDQNGVPITPKIASEMRVAGWRWSAHTHPGLGRDRLMASGDDIDVLKAFGQQNGLVLNSRGDWRPFDTLGSW